MSDGGFASGPGLSKTSQRLRDTSKPRRTTADNNGSVIEPIGTGSAEVTSGVTSADGWIVVPNSHGGIPAVETAADRELERIAFRPRPSG